MLNEDQRISIESLSDVELEYELARGSASRFQREKFDYLRVVHERRQQAFAEATQAAVLDATRDGVAATKSGIRWATTGWIVVAAVTIIGVVVAALK
ncbi:hypothetical protein [Hydrogenophaga taeniospiralis]|uniref:hypothetical protein n=1 Tax=Hydrogenophaga taeniospiralis TaxID=65656 RepID=UPI001CFB1A3E|nr:hypothetical protein [Hydrogenophaga taeniospiralis]UCU95767.1 hypothetical protein KI616_07980 [Hydrogenophaga taeniospiralis]